MGTNLDAWQARAYLPDLPENPSRVPIACYWWTALRQVEAVGSCGCLAVNPERLGAPGRPVAPVASNAVLPCRPPRPQR
jgi:hypothetical protein